MPRVRNCAHRASSLCRHLHRVASRVAMEGRVARAGSNSAPTCLSWQAFCLVGRSHNQSRARPMGTIMRTRSRSSPSRGRTGMPLLPQPSLRGGDDARAHVHGAAHSRTHPHASPASTMACVRHMSDPCVTVHQCAWPQMAPHWMTARVPPAEQPRQARRTHLHSTARSHTHAHAWAWAASTMACVRHTSAPCGSVHQRAWPATACSSIVTGRRVPNSTIEPVSQRRTPRPPPHASPASTMPRVRPSSAPCTRVHQRA